MIHFFCLRYIRLKERAESQKEDSKHETNTSAEEIFTPERRSTRQNIDTTLPAQSNPCITCNNLKRKEDNKEVSIGENRRAKLFLSATKFFKDTVSMTGAVFWEILEMYLLLIFFIIKIA